MSENTWLLVTPPEDAKGAKQFPGEGPSPDLLHAVKALGMRSTWDAKARKFYAGLPAKVKPAPSKPADSDKPGGVTYPNGNYANRHFKNNDPSYAPADFDAASPLVEAPAGFKVSEHFSLDEFRPKSSAYDGVRCHPELVKALEKIRVRVGKVVHVTSGYRPPAYNRSVGGVSNSQHLDGLAADIYVDDMSTSALHAICESVIGNGGGVGYYPTQRFVHVDVRGYRSRWTG